MSMTKLDKSDFLLDDVTDPMAADNAFLDAACETLAAERSDLEPLLAYIQSKSIAHRQVPSLLKQAYARLKELRAKLSDPTDSNPEIAPFIKQAATALQTSDAFSLEKADTLLEQAWQLGLELDDKVPAAAAFFRSSQALIAAASQDYGRAAELFEQTAAIAGLEEAAEWRVQNERALILLDLGREFKDIDALERAVELFETVVIALAPQKQRPQDWATTQDNLGKALGVLGQRHRGTQLLERSIAAFNAALSERTRELTPLDWATSQNNLGNALGVLGQRHADADMIVKAVEAFENALLERSREKTPQDWASTQNNLGAALQSLGSREDGTKLLSKAVKAYKNVLEVWTRQHAPLEWATTLNNLGTSLRILGERQSGDRSLEKSVAAFNNALKERTFERVPQDWAMTQNNLGAALQALGTAQEGTQELEDAVAAYENALKVWTAKQNPMGWAMTKANLGVARRALAERAMDVDVARLAVDDFQAAVDVFRGASHAQYMQLGEEQLSKARGILEGLGGS